MGIVEYVLSNLHICVPVGIILAYVLTLVFAKRTLPDNVPWVGKDNTGAFAKIRASIEYFKNGQQLLNTGYEGVRRQVHPTRDTADFYST